MKKQIKKLIKESKADIKLYHLERIRDNDEYGDNKEIKTADDVIAIVNDWEMTPDEDLTYILGRIDALQELLR